jgi:hypothetical protein
LYSRDTCQHVKQNPGTPKPCSAINSPPVAKLGSVTLGNPELMGKGNEATSELKELSTPWNLYNMHESCD